MPPRRRLPGKGLSGSRAIARPGRERANGRPAPSGECDWLRLQGVQAYGHLGVTAKERDLGQRVEVDIELAYSIPRTRRPDSIDAYIDYEELGRTVRTQIERSRCKLIETLAEELALLLLEEFDTPCVRIRLRKLHIPVSDFSGVPEIEIERSRR